MFGDVVRIRLRLDPVGEGVGEQVFHEKPLGRRAQPAAPVPGQEGEADLVTATGGTAPVVGLPTRDPDQRVVRQHDGERGGVRADVAVLLPAAAPRLRILETRPHERSQRLRIGHDPLQKGKVRFRERSQRWLVIHGHLVVV